MESTFPNKFRKAEILKAKILNIFDFKIFILNEL